MSDLSSLALDTSIMMSSLNAVPMVGSSAIGSKVQAVNNSPTKNSTPEEQGIYAVKGDSLYKEEMDLNSDGTITNDEMAQYYAKVAKEYGSEFPSVPQKPVSNIATVAQAVNAYAASEFAFSHPTTSFLDVGV